MNESLPPLISPVPPKKSGMPTWAIVLIAVGGLGVVGIAVIGLLAAIAIPNFVKAKETAQRNVCINNLRQIDGAKQQWALENKKKETDTPTESEVVKFLSDGQMLVCPAEGVYTINEVGQAPTCSKVTHVLPAY